MRATAIAICLLLAAPAAAKPINPVLHPVKFVKSWRQHNRGVDRDERMGVREFFRSQRGAPLPARLQPATVLQRKMSRAQKTLGQLTRDANETRYMSWGLGGAVVKFEDTFYGLNKLSSQLKDVRAYATARGLKQPNTRALSREAVSAMRWHANAPFRIRGIIVNDFGKAYHQALSNYREMSQQ